MSNGPIAAWWRSWKPVKVSTPDSKRVCAGVAPDLARGLCGRSSATRVDVRLSVEAARVTCADCVAAARADAAAE